jgi:hypothetical protein
MGTRREASEEASSPLRASLVVLRSEDSIGSDLEHLLELVSRASTAAIRSGVRRFFEFVFRGVPL